VRQANDAATGRLVPDLTLVLDLDPDVARARQLRAGKGLDRLEREPADFHQRVAAAYRSANGAGVRHIAAGTSPDAVLATAWRMVFETRPMQFRLRDD
jgi:dTMP kinase